MDNNISPPINIPTEQLSSEALVGLIEEFVLREGTDYGNYEYSLDEKKNHIFKQLQSGKILVVFDPNIESTTLLKSDEFHKLVFEFNSQNND